MAVMTHGKPVLDDDDDAAAKVADTALLKHLAKRYVWWKTPEQALVFPRRVIAQVMDIGDYQDVLAMAAQLGDEQLKDVLAHAEAGQFSPRSWAYWHYRLGLAEVDQVPPVPTRRFG